MPPPLSKWFINLQAGKHHSVVSIVETEGNFIIFVSVKYLQNFGIHSGKQVA